MLKSVIQRVSCAHKILRATLAVRHAASGIDYLIEPPPPISKDLALLHVFHGKPDNREFLRRGML